MTSRERWTIYPLLFLSLGLAFRAVALPFDKAAVQRIEAGTVVCGEIVLAADDGTKLVHIGRVQGAGGGRVEIFDGRGRDAIAIGTTADASGGAIEFFDANGKPAGRVGADDAAPRDQARSSD